MGTVTRNNKLLSFVLIEVVSVDIVNEGIRFDSTQRTI